MTMIKAGQPIIDEEEIAAAVEVLRSGRLVKGPVTEAFETAFAAKVRATHAIAVCNGTIALYAALIAHGIGPGDQVITTPWTFIATANMIRAVGAEPVFCDIDPVTFNLDPRQVEQRLAADRDRIKALLPVHLYGQPADLTEFRRLAEQYHLILIEDGAQAHGAAWQGQPVGSSGTVTWSFFPSKNAHAGGEGGMITANIDMVAEKIRLLRNHGRVGTYNHADFGWNFRLPEICAAVGLVQVGRLAAMNALRQVHAAYLSENLRGLPGLVIPQTAPGAGHVYHQYTIRIRGQRGFPLNRDEFVDYMQRQGIETPVHYPTPVHLQPAYTKIRPWGQFPVAEQVAREVVSLPVHPSLTHDDLTWIVAAIRALYD